MSEMAWFVVVLGLLLLVLALQAVGSYISYHVFHESEAEKRERAAARARHPSAQGRKRAVGGRPDRGRKAA